MITFGDYIRASSLDEAYEIISKKKPARIYGGGMYLRMGDRRIGIAVDLSDLGLDTIEETEDGFSIGAMATLRMLETNEGLNSCYENLFKQGLKDIIGVQFRNIATVGGTVYNKYGFSDVIPPLLAVNAVVHFHNSGSIALKDYLVEEKYRRDVLVNVTVPKVEGAKASIKTARISRSDYPALVVAASKIDGKSNIVVGARPKRAALAEKAMEYVDSQEKITEEVAIRAGEIAAEELTFGTNTRGTKEYRKHICKVLVKRALLEVE